MVAALYCRHSLCLNKGLQCLCRQLLLHILGPCQALLHQLQKLGLVFLLSLGVQQSLRDWAGHTRRHLRM